MPKADNMKYKMKYKTFKKTTPDAAAAPSVVQGLRNDQENSQTRRQAEKMFRKIDGLKNVR